MPPPSLGQGLLYEQVGEVVPLLIDEIKDFDLTNSAQDKMPLLLAGKVFFRVHLTGVCLPCNPYWDLSIPNNFLLYSCMCIAVCWT